MKFDKSKVYTAANADEVKIGSEGYFADTLAGLKAAVINEDASCFSKAHYINPDENIYRFCPESFDGDYALFYLVEEPESESKPKIKEVTAAEWDNKPRVMKVWDYDYSKAVEAKVLLVRSTGGWCYPVVAVTLTDENVCAYKHCAEIEEPKESEIEKHYRPYKDTDEFIADYKNRFCPDCKGIPAIWARNKVGTLREIVSIDDDGVRLTGAHILFVTYSDFFNTYTYTDGSPVGAEI